MGQFDQVYPFYQQASQYCPNNFELIRCNAIYLYESQQFNQALELFNLLFEEYTNYEIDYLYLRYGIYILIEGITFYELNQKENALNIFGIVKDFNNSFPSFIHYDNLKKDDVLRLNSFILIQQPFLMIKKNCTSKKGLGFFKVNKRKISQIEELLFKTNFCTFIRKNINFFIQSEIIAKLLNFGRALVKVFAKYLINQIICKQHTNRIMIQELEQENMESKQIFLGLAKQVKRETKQRLNKIIHSAKTNFFKILEFQKVITQQIDAIEFESLCFLYLFCYSRRQEKFKSEIDAFLTLITKLTKIRELVKLLKSLKEENEIIEKLSQLRDYLLSCIIKFYFHVYGIKYEEEYGFVKYYYQIDKLITKKKIENLGSLDQLEKEIWKQNIPPEEHQDQEKLLEIVITKTCLYFSYYLFNPQLIFQIHKIIKKFIFIYKDRWITQLVNLIQILNPYSDIFMVGNNLLDTQQGFVLKILFLQQHLVDSFYKIGNQQNQSTKVTIYMEFICCIKDQNIGFFGNFTVIIYSQELGFILDISKDYEFLQNCCQHILQHTNQYKSQCCFYLYFVNRQLGKPDQALKYIEEAISLDNTNLKYLRQKGIILKDKGQVEDARNYYRESLKLANDPLSINNLGKTYSSQNDYKQALQTFKQANKIKQDNLIINYNIIDSLFKLKQYDECLEQCQLMIESTPYINNYKNIVRIFINKNRQKEAIQQLQLLKQFESSKIWVINYDLLNYWYYYQISLYCSEQSQYPTAIYYLFNSIKLNPISKVMLIGPSIVNYLLDLQNLQDDELKEFKEKIKEQLKLDQNCFYYLSFYISSYMKIADYHYDKKNHSQYSFIINNLSQSIDLEEIKNSYQLELVEQILQVQIVKMNFFNALETYFKLNEDSNIKTNIQNNYLQVIYTQTGQLYDQFIINQIQNNQEKLYLELMEGKQIIIPLGYFFFYQNNFYEAEFYFENQIQQNPNNIDARLMLGNIYQKLKKYEESIVQFDHIICLDKINNWAYIHKAYSYFCMGFKDQIYKLYQQASEFIHHDFALINCNAIYLHESQLFEQALELFNLLFQTWYCYIYTIGMTYYELNDKPNALGKFKQTYCINQMFIPFVNQGFIYEKDNRQKALQFYIDIKAIFNRKEKDYLDERIKVIQTSYLGQDIQN
ncbi:hypothetical protein pb186bvf_020303 [Paramecium bursaria]